MANPTPPKTTLPARFLKATDLGYPFPPGLNAGHNLAIPSRLLWALLLAAALAALACWTMPAFADSENATWSATLVPFGATAKGCWSEGTIAGCDNNLHPFTFAYGGETYKIERVVLTTWEFMYLRLNGTIPGVQNATLVVGNTSLSFDASAAKSPRWYDTGIDWSDTDTVSLSLWINQEPVAPGREPVLANGPPVGADKTITMRANATYTFNASDFGFSDPDAGDSLKKVRITALQSAGSLKLDGTQVTLNQEVAVGDVPRLVFEPAPGASGSTYATFKFKVSDGAAYSSRANTITMSVQPEESPADNQQQQIQPLVTNEAPVIVLAGSSSMTLPVNTAYTEPGYTATDQEDGDLTGSVVITGTVNATRIGTYHLYYDVSDSSGNAATRQVRTVSVADQTAPVITLTGAPQMTIAVGSTYAEPGYTATDQEDGDLTGSVVITGTVDATRIGTYHLYYDVRDSSGNAATRQVRTVSVADQTAPVITLTGAPQMAITVGSTYAEPGYTATDQEDGDLTGSVVITGTVDATRIGTYHLYYDVSDSSDNAATRQVRTVSVADQTAPVITLTGAPQMAITVGSAYVEPGYTATDNYDGDLTGSVVITGTVDTAQEGTYHLYYDVSDSSGNAATRQVRTVSVADQTAPVITLTGSSQIVLPLGTAYVEPGYTATDREDGDLTGNVTITKTLSYCLPLPLPAGCNDPTGGVPVTGEIYPGRVGTYTLYYDVSDSSGNAAIQQVRKVSVNDETAPVITLEGATQMTITVGAAYAEPGYTATDNYDGDVTERVIITGTVDTAQAGTYHLYYDVTDGAGNAATQQARTVIVATETDTTPDPQAGLSDVVKRYDADGNGVIDQQEWAKAIEDYTNDIITNEDIYAISAARS